jgi:hypothetical protein
MSKERINAIFMHVGSYKSTKISDERLKFYVPEGCMHRRFITKKTWLSAFIYAQSHNSFGSFLPLPWFSCSLFSCSLVFFSYSYCKIRFGVFCVVCMEKMWVGLYISLICLNVFFAIFNFDKT